jgi:hypothetical protein
MDAASTNTSTGTRPMRIKEPAWNMIDPLPLCL